MKITFFIGSPKRNKKCSFLIEQAIEGIKSMKGKLERNILYISDYNLTPCNVI